MFNPVSLYYIVVDKGRKRHLRFIEEEFTFSDLADYTGSIRTTALKVSSPKVPTLGAQISVQQSINSSKIGGNS